jgi:hypothetical protein
MNELTHVCLYYSLTIHSAPFVPFIIASVVLPLAAAIPTPSILCIIKEFGKIDHLSFQNDQHLIIDSFYHDADCVL